MWIESHVHYKKRPVCRESYPRVPSSILDLESLKSTSDLNSNLLKHMRWRMNREIFPIPRTVNDAACFRGAPCFLDLNRSPVHYEKSPVCHEKNPIFRGKSPTHACTSPKHDSLADVDAIRSALYAMGWLPLVGSLK